MQTILVQSPAKNIRFNIGSHFNVLPLGQVVASQE